MTDPSELTDPSEPIAPATLDGSICQRCGCGVPRAGQQRHEVWHDFVESGIAELVAAVATLESRAPNAP